MSETNGSDPNEPLPTLLTVTSAFTRRLPSQRLLDQLAHLESAVPFGELVTQQPFRVIAFRALLRDYPGRDPGSLWMHAYEVEVDVADAVDPTNGASLTPPLGSVDFGVASPLTSTT
jgi:hypothetical protein